MKKSKFCTRCSKRKLRKYFSRDQSRPDGLNGWCKKCIWEKSRKYLQSKNKQSREARTALRLEILRHYSGKDVPECACCFVNILEFLGIDHINGGGNKHKKEVRHVYEWLKRSNFPEGFRVLCHNCNQSIGAYGYCPHNRIK